MKEINISGRVATKPCIPSYYIDLWLGICKNNEFYVGKNGLVFTTTYRCGYCTLEEYDASKGHIFATHPVYHDRIDVDDAYAVFEWAEEDPKVAARELSYWGIDKIYRCDGDVTATLDALEFFLRVEAHKNEIEYYGDVDASITNEIFNN